MHLPLQGSISGDAGTGLELENLQTLVTSTNELADTLRAVRWFEADCTWSPFRRMSTQC